MPQEQGSRDFAEAISASASSNSQGRRDERDFVAAGLVQRGERRPVDQVSPHLGDPLSAVARPVAKRQNSARSDHDSEDLRSIAAVERFRTVYDSDWPAAIPSLGRRLHNHVACGDCPLGRRQAGAAAHLIERRA